MKRTALVSGGNRGIGLAIVTAFAQQGNSVWLGSRDLSEGERVAASLREGGLDVTAVQLDLADALSIESAVNHVQGAGHPIDVLVNNAGVYHDRPLLELTDAEIAESLSVHLTGPIRLIQALVPKMVSRGYGRIVNVSSGWGSFAEGLGGPGAYGITKAALNALTVRLANELPSTIKVNSMCPGWVRTRMGGSGATRTPEEGAKTAIWLATLPGDGPSGGFFRDEKPIEW
ncbi:SDR family NAD(P)-dependent oxidoreductase [Rubinisphaera brasiliensis]|uniref:3-oxoacyl-(Acyl-carrier-protein) reductase n=1 Tax=Rubinisphaera brasiliensis (strain ATCC 49424 / DSM 5305 / JCM 21570 / IAM 15109 / NBRC 103401 / IFAM 1448) TaxID=756272 RepID=F0SSV9_RUBBR|nr:SDR family NAD(P)-dependent oxidoreductase [Rubinisphaera brasiliensis]ADY61437.1 3-oxoacyl-(acyl-carrier-protein) reductase [Rubinisphaera brasiliensis DSM 5305]